jgi:DNA-binding XRE family transcriptional regulator
MQVAIFILPQIKQPNNSLALQKGEFTMATSEVRKIVRDRTWLEKARRVSNKTQKEVADAAGCSETFYNRIEKGLQMPNVDIALRIADFLNCDAHNFLREKVFSE